jgi:hypothetical protein
MNDVFKTPEKTVRGEMHSRVRTVDFDALRDSSEPEMTTYNFGELHSEFDDYGRKINVKKDAFGRIIDEHSIIDAYLFMRDNSNLFPTPNRNLGFGDSIMRSVLSDLYGWSDEEMDEVESEYGSHARMIRN